MSDSIPLPPQKNMVYNNKLLGPKCHSALNVAFIFLFLIPRQLHFGGFSKNLFLRKYDDRIFS